MGSARASGSLMFLFYKIRPFGLYYVLIEIKQDRFKLING